MWVYEGKEIKSKKDIPKEFQSSYGFIYNIVAHSDKYPQEYIGSKVLEHSANRIIGKKEVLEKGKSAFRRRKCKKGKKKGEWIYYEEGSKESNWINYTGSSDQLNEDIKRGMKVTKYILRFIKNKSHLLYEETKEIMCSGGLESDKFYNQHVIKRFYKKNIMK